MVKVVKKGRAKKNGATKIDTRERRSRERRSRELVALLPPNPTQQEKDAFVERMADVYVEAIQAERKKRGLPPLPKE